MPGAATQTLVESDNNYIGFASRIDPTNLPPGIAQYAQNIRMQRGTAQPRKGTKRISDSTLEPLTIVGSGLYVNSAGQDNIVLVFSDRFYLYNTETESFSGAQMFPTGRGIVQGGVCDVVQALDKLYIFRGQYVDPNLEASITNPSIANGATGTVTVTTVSNHGYSTGDEVSFYYNTHDNSDSSADGNHIITRISDTVFEFTFTNTSGNNMQSHASAHAGYYVRRGKPPFIWTGSGAVEFAQQKYFVSGGVRRDILLQPPPSDFGFYFQNRLVVKYSDDQLVVGDILSEVMDLTFNNFKINQGGNDSIVGVLPWVDNQFLVFMQRSIYIAYVETDNFTQGSSPGAQSFISVVTTQVGCTARKSIVAAGQFVFFLSGKGVHMLTPQLDLKVIGQTVPLSEPVDDFFDDVNFSAVSKSSAVYYDNRFLISVPTGNRTRNFKTLVYNTLNKNWESVDVYPADGSDVMYQDDWQVCQYRGKRRLFMLTRYNGGGGSYGGIFLTEEVEAGDEFKALTGRPILPFVLPATIESAAGQVFPVDARIKSREYAFESVQTKRFSRGEFQFSNTPGDIISVIAHTHDPDVDEEVLRYEFSGSSAQDTTVRPRIALRGASIDVETVFIKGRPQLKGGAVYAIVTNRNMETQE